MEQRLSRSERLETVGRLASGIAHDSNNLLTVILSNLELALALGVLLLGLAVIVNAGVMALRASAVRAAYA